jgi:hypothetical protein
MKNVRGIEAILARHCAPVIFGKKPAALLSSRALPEKYQQDDLSRYGLRTARLVNPRRPLLFLLYRPELLEQTLLQPDVRRVLSTLGYPNVQRESWKCLLDVLQRRFAESDEFPHEVGLFLGYPTADVLGFITRKRESCKLRGLWRVYDNAEQAEKRFAEFEHQRKVLSAFIASGGSIGNANLSELAG